MGPGSVGILEKLSVSHQPTCGLLPMPAGHGCSSHVQVQMPVLSPLVMDVVGFIYSLDTRFLTYKIKVFIGLSED